MKNKLITTIVVLLSSLVFFGAECTDSNTNVDTGKTILEKNIGPGDDIQIFTAENVKIIFPRSAITHPAKLIIKTVPAPPASGEADYKVGKYIYDIIIEGQTNFNVNFTIEITYDAAELPAGTDPNTAFKGVFHNGSNWIELPTEFNQPSNIIRITTNHLTKFGYLIKTS